ncbi:alkaline phosphatase family protein [Clostridium sp. YIM B02505]|uniref:Alkaline phosphatase family protein n=1 Tax=Clostridium yunnanense TaxID=2800325 RepID=A0ABS1EV44_9CLOT|nr:alkaline phosphatase family protein [Clostridium yunnanense]MBK1813194.1 alkaline phosphatase family protein [Clostridium yunnanense]
MFVDYSNSIVNLACSILEHFGADSEHNTLKEVDELLKYQYKNVVVLLLDGLGVDALQYHLSENSFFRKNLVKEYSSVFPPTTTSATTSIETGLTPLEHGWLGWSLYFSELDKIVNAFINTEKDTEIQAADYHVASKIIPYKSIYEKIKAAGIANAYSVSKFGSNKIKTFDELTDEVKRLCSTSEKKYIYGYWETPDSLMHEFGCYNSVVTENIKELEEKVADMCKSLSDTLVIVTADHGHCNLKHYILSDYPNLLNMLKRPTSIETRATAFYIKDEHLDDFPIEFNNNFGDDFLLYSKEEVIEKNIFGDGKIHPKFEEFIGDYLAIAISDKGIVYSEDSKQFISNHAGMTEKEMKIPLIAICKK